MAQPGIWVLGGYQSDFARNLHREGKDFADLAREVIDGTLAAAPVDAGQVGVIHVGNAFGQLFAGQGHLGAMPATVHPGLWGVPASRHEAACASGSIAALAAMADLRAGNYDAGRRLRRPHAPRRQQAGQRHGRRVPGGGDRRGRHP